MNILKNVNNRINRKSTEDGITLVEIVVVIVIISVLASIALLVFSNQQKESVKVTIKSDVSSNRAQILSDKLNPSGLYISPETFVKKAVRTADNTVGYTVNPARTKACTWGEYSFSDTETYYYHFDSETGVMTEGPCETNTGWDSVVVSPEGDLVSDGGTPAEPTPTTPPTNSGGATPPPAGGGGSLSEEDKLALSKEMNYGFFVDDPRLSFDVANVDSSAANRACFAVDVTTESSTPVDAVLKIDTNYTPFKGNNFGSETRYAGAYTFSSDGDIVTLSGRANGADRTVTAGDTARFGQICSYGLNGSNASVIREAQPVNVVAGKATGNTYWASQSFTVTGSGEFYGRWTAEIDFGDLIAQSENANRPIKFNGAADLVTIEHTSGTRYRVTVKDTLNNMHLAVKNGTTLNVTFTI